MALPTEFFQICDPSFFVNHRILGPLLIPPGSGSLLHGHHLQEVDRHHHLGILHSILFSNLAHISERCAAGRSAFLR